MARCHVRPPWLFLLLASFVMLSVHAGSTYPVAVIPPVSMIPSIGFGMTFDPNIGLLSSVVDMVSIAPSTNSYFFVTDGCRVYRVGYAFNPGSFVLAGSVSDCTSNTVESGSSFPARGPFSQLAYNSVADKLFVSSGCRIRVITGGLGSTPTISSYLGNKASCTYVSNLAGMTAATMTFASVTGLLFVPSTQTLYIAEDCRLLAYSLASNTFTHIAGAHPTSCTYFLSNNPKLSNYRITDMVYDDSNRVCFMVTSVCTIICTTAATNIRTYGTGVCAPNTMGASAVTTPLTPEARSMSFSTGTFYYTDQCAINSINVASPTITRFTGTPTACQYGGDEGPFASAVLDDNPGALLATFGYGSQVYVMFSSTANRSIRQVTLSDAPTISKLEYISFRG